MLIDFQEKFFTDLEESGRGRNVREFYEEWSHTPREYLNNKTPREYFEAVKQEYIDRRDLMIERLNKIPGVYSPMPMGAFYTTARLPIDDADKFAQWLLESFNYKGQTVMVAPAAGFYATPGKGLDEVRIAYVLKKEDIANAMDCLEEALKQYPGRR